MGNFSLTRDELERRLDMLYGNDPHDTPDDIYRGITGTLGIGNENKEEQEDGQ